MFPSRRPARPGPARRRKRRHPARRCCRDRPETPDTSRASRPEDDRTRRRPASVPRATGRNSLSSAAARRVRGADRAGRGATRGRPADGTVATKRHEIENAIGVDVSKSQCHHIAETIRRGHLAKLPGLTVFEHMNLARCVEQRGVRIAIAIQIGGRERPQTDDAGEGAEHPPGAVAVVAEGRGRLVAHAGDEVEVAVHFEVHGPHSETVGGQRRASRRSGGRVGERAVARLNEQPDPPRPAIARSIR